ncbi:MAG: ABC-type Fe3+ transport system protein [Labilithrix sp.]|nr:ABC-type Fe3+ transport system protein [Labilithrix sp.]
MADARDLAPVIGEFDSPEALQAAAVRLGELGFGALEAYTPFPMPALESALRVRRTRLPVLVFLAGAAGCALAYGIQSYLNAVDYRLDVGGRPFNSIPAHVPIMFETTVLFAALAAFLAALLLSGLPRLHHRVFELDGFERTTIDRFWITCGEALDDARRAELLAELERLGAVAVRGGAS